METHDNLNFGLVRTILRSNIIKKPVLCVHELSRYVLLNEFIKHILINNLLEQILREMLVPYHVFNVNIIICHSFSS